MNYRTCLFALVTLPLMAADASGTWKLEGDIAGVHISRVCTFKQSENKLTGSCKNQANDLPLTGSVKDKSITWSYDADYQGQKVTLDFKGQFESDTAIKGSIETQGVSGSFTANKQ